MQKHCEIAGNHMDKRMDSMAGRLEDALTLLEAAADKNQVGGFVSSCLCHFFVCLMSVEINDSGVCPWCCSRRTKTTHRFNSAR